MSSWLSLHQIEKQSQYDEDEASQQKKYDARSHAWVLFISDLYELRAKMRRKISISSIKELTFTARLKVLFDTRIHIDDENICRDDDSIEEINEEEEDIMK